jgi:hypothetical protein
VLTRFLQTFADSGRAELPWPGRDVEAFIAGAGKDELDRREANRILSAWHREFVAELPGPPLAYHSSAALWGAMMCYRAACFICFREISAATIQRLLPGEPLPDPESPEAIFSADITLRHWPEFFRMARARSEDDPLILAMQRLAAQVPLSSLGMHIPVDPTHALFHHAGLRQLFAERALERADHACLAVPEVADFIRAKLGAYGAALGRGLLPPPAPALPFTP